MMKEDDAENKSSGESGRTVDSQNDRSEVKVDGLQG